MAEAPRANERPFQVWVVDGVIHSGYGSENAAQKAADRANTSALKLGITTRYEVRAKDDSDG